MNPFQQQAPIEGIRKIIAVGSGKGGVGKSTVSTNLAISLAKKGQKVGLLDADLYGPSVPRMMGLLNQKPGIDDEKKIIPIERYGVKVMSMGLLVAEDQALVWRGPMLFKAMDQFFRDVKWGELDFLLIDLPPGTGDVTLTMAQKVPVDGGITVCTPQNIALIDAKKSMQMFDQVNVRNLGVVENMSYFKPTPESEPIQLFPKGELDAFLKSKHVDKLVEVPFDTHIALAAESGIPIVESDESAPESQAYLELAQKLITNFDS